MNSSSIGCALLSLMILSSFAQAEALLIAKCDKVLNPDVSGRANNSVEHVSVSLYVYPNGTMSVIEPYVFDGVLPRRKRIYEGDGLDSNAFDVSCHPNSSNTRDCVNREDSITISQSWSGGDRVKIYAKFNKKNNVMEIQSKKGWTSEAHIQLQCTPSQNSPSGSFPLMSEANSSPHTTLAHETVILPESAPQFEGN